MTHCKSRIFPNFHLVILLRSRKLGDPCLLGIDGDLDRELLELAELLELDLLLLDLDLDLDPVLDLDLEGL